MTQPPPIDEVTLLCERCGYIIEGLPEAGMCPECGEAIRASLPERRRRFEGFDVKKWPPSPLQIARHARVVFDHMPLDRATNKGVKELFLGLSMFIAMLPVIIHAVWTVANWVFRGPLPDARAVYGWSFLYLFVALATVLMTCFGLLGLTHIEMLGIRLYGRRRRWRITKTISHAICVHAASAWVVATLGALLGYVLCRTFGFWTEPGTLIVFSAVGFLPGFLLFEALVYIGMVRCKFANLPRAIDARPPLSEGTNTTDAADGTGPARSVRGS